MTNLTELADRVTFSENTIDGRNNWQYIILDGVVLGASCERPDGFLNPIKVHYQSFVPESERPFVDWGYAAGCDGFMFGCFDTLEGFLAYHLERGRLS